MLSIARGRRRLAVVAVALAAVLGFPGLAHAEPTPPPGLGPAVPTETLSPDQLEAIMAKYRRLMDKVSKTPAENRTKNLRAPMYSLGLDVYNAIPNCSMVFVNTDADPGIWSTPPPPSGAAIAFQGTSANFQLIQYGWQPNSGSVDLYCPRSGTIPNITGLVTADFLWFPERFYAYLNPLGTGYSSGWAGPQDNGWFTMYMNPPE